MDANHFAEVDDVARYLDLARRYRELASQATNDHSRETLLFLAEDFDAKADELSTDEPRRPLLRGAASNP